MASDEAGNTTCANIVPIGGLQLRAHLRKTLIEKKRNGKVTFCEFFSHLIIVLILSWGFSLSKVVYVDETDYSMVQISVPPPFIDPVGEPEVRPLEVVKYIEATMRGPLLTPDLETWLQIGVATQEAIAGAGIDIESYFGGTSYYQRFANIINSGHLHLAPAGEMTDSLIKHMKANAPSLVTYASCEEGEQGSSVSP